MKSQNEIREIIGRLSNLYPQAGPELKFSNPFETLIATMLSAQCTDIRVNMVTETLFRDYPDAKTMANVPLHELEDRIKTCGLYHMKAVHILETCRALSENYGGVVPEDRKELTDLPGVGNKTAAVVLMAAFGRDYIPVDTHVFRLAHRIGLVENAKTADETERQLSVLIPDGQKGHVHHLLIWHGRRMCTARKPECEKCPLSNGLCDFKNQE